MILSEKIIESARECLGVKFSHQGRTMQGMDCVGVLVHCAASVGAIHKDHDGYSRNPQNGLLKEILDSQDCLIEINKKEMKAGDFLLMRITREPMHVAVFTGKTVIHSWSASKKVIEHRLNQEWISRIKSVYRIKL